MSFKMGHHIGPGPGELGEPESLVSQGQNATLIIILSDHHRAAKSRPNSSSRQFLLVPSFEYSLVLTRVPPIIYITCLPTTALTTPPTEAYSAWTFSFDDGTPLQASYSLRKIDIFPSPLLDTHNLAEPPLAQLHGLHHWQELS
jgi:hypothetical protein